MQKLLSSLLSSLLLGLMSNPVGSQTPPGSTARHLTSSSCSNAHGWIRISAGDITGNLSCFSPEIHGGYALIIGGGVNGRDDISIQMNFLSRPGTHTCGVPMVEIEFQEQTERWDAYRVRNGRFGECTITQTFEKGRKVWKGHATAILVVVKGNTTSGSPRYLHSQKDRSGKQLTKNVDVEWEFDRLFSLGQRSSDPSKRN
jgi:hypothetical protein